MNEEDEVIIATESEVPVYTKRYSVGNGRKIVLMRNDPARAVLFEGTVHVFQVSDSPYWLRDPSGQEHQYARISRGHASQEISETVEIAHYLGATKIVAYAGEEGGQPSLFQRLPVENASGHIGPLTEEILILRK